MTLETIILAFAAFVIIGALLGIATGLYALWWLWRRLK